MKQMLYGCSSLTNIGDLSNWNTSSMTDLTNMFGYCNALESIGDLSNWNVSNVESLFQMFRDCGSLKTVGDLSRWDTSKVTDIRSMFNCYGMASHMNNIGLPPIPKVETTESMMYNCGALSNIIACGKISHYLRFYNSPLTHESALKVLNALDPEVEQMVVFPATVYDALSADDIKIATDKGWTVQRW